MLTKEQSEMAERCSPFYGEESEECEINAESLLSDEDDLPF